MTLPYSFELFPPRTPNGFDRIDRTVEMFAKLDPAFVSVTFGAGGSDSRHSLGVLQRLLDAGVPPMAHLTCVGLDVEQASRLVRSFLDAGITRFLALRGDLPHDAGDRVTDLRSAAELVQLIDRVDTEREPYQSLLLPGLRRSEIRDRQSKTEISVAAFPNGHPGAGVHRSDVAALLAKQSVGATMAITQLFFDPFDYLEFVDLARAKGVTIPIVPGIVIPTFLRRLERSAELSGERLPTELARRLDGASDDDARRIGVDTAVALIDELRDHDIPGIHLAPSMIIAPRSMCSTTSASPASGPHLHRSTMALFPNGTILGYPRIGPDRELKRALEANWRGRIDDAEFARRTSELRLADLQRLVELGLSPDDASLPLETAHYDHVLDATLTFGAVPPRLRDAVTHGLAWEWLLARGDVDRAPLEMTKWFDTNYHYLVPELDAETTFSLADTRIVDRFIEARAAGFHTRPAVVGPATYLALAKAEGVRTTELADRLVPLYRELAERLAAAGATWLQLDEPALVADLEGFTPVELQGIARSGARAVREGGLKVLLAAGYGESSGRVEALASDVDAIAFDLVRGGLPAVTDTPLVAGVVHGRNVWRTDLDKALETLRASGSDVSSRHHDTAAARAPHA